MSEESEDFATKAFRAAMGDAAPATQPKPERHPMRWSELADRTPPDREYAIPFWIGMSHVTLLVGPGGVGKTLLAQQLGSVIATGQPFIDTPPCARKVLMWACEDDHDELWRRQLAIASWQGAVLDDYSDRFILEPRVGRDNTLVSAEYGRLLYSPLLEELRAQCEDYHAEVLILDNSSHVFAGNESDRHHVTAFIAALMGAAPGRAIVLLSHPGRASGSEYSGSSAWENTVRMRLYLGRTLPDAKDDDERDAVDDGVRYLARRKSNYTGRDYVKLTLTDGALVPDSASARGENISSEMAHDLRLRRSRRVVIDGARKLAELGLHGSEMPTAQTYLPAMLIRHKLHEGLTKRELGEALVALMHDRRLERKQVGHYANRVPRFGLVVAD